MIKKIGGITGRILMIMILLLSQYIMPVEVNARAETLNDLKDELYQLEEDRDQNESDIKYTEDQIKEKSEDIAEAHAAIETSKLEVEQTKKDIEESNIKIEDLSESATQLFVLQTQIRDQEKNLEYITGATSMTDLIMRSKALEILLNESKNQINIFENLILENQQKELDLIKEQETLNNNISSYEAKIDSLEGNLTSFVEITMDIDEEIENQRNLIAYYEDLGCKADQNLEDCVEIANNTGWLKPTTSGYISSGYGYRWIWGSYSFHNAVDIAGNKEGTNIYSATTGTVAAVTYRSSCGGNKVYIHSYVNGEPYTISYLHMLNVYVEVGDKVSNQDVIGTVGGGSQTYWDNCSTGAHLHFGVATGLYYGGGPDGYTSYSTYIARSIEPPGFPSLGGKYTSRTHWFS